MAWPIIAAGISLLGNAAAAYQARELGESNAALSRRAARDARSRGVYDAERLRLQARSVMGRQRAGFAGQNVAVDEGVAVDVAGDTAYLTEMDAITILNNAAKEAWYHRQRAAAGQFESTMQSRVYAGQAIGAGLTGVGDYLARYD